MQVLTTAPSRLPTGARAPAVAHGPSAPPPTARRPRLQSRHWGVRSRSCSRQRARRHVPTAARATRRSASRGEITRDHRDHTRSLLLSAYGLLKPLLSPLFTSADYRMMTSITVADPRSPRCLSAACAHDGARSCVCVLIILHPRCGVVTNVVTSAGSAESVGSLVEALYECVRRRFAMLIAMLIAC
jgi:hypothetical protein